MNLGVERDWGFSEGWVGAKALTPEQKLWGKPPSQEGWSQGLGVRKWSLRGRKGAVQARGSQWQRGGKETRARPWLTLPALLLHPHPYSRQGWGKAWEAVGPTTPG